MSFCAEYTIQLRDTDAAGVMYFANIVSICHIAYEASLIAADIDLKLFVNNPKFAVPITHISADFFRPLFCGDRVIIELFSRSIDPDKFEIEYQIRSASGTIAAIALTKHVVIDPNTRQRKNIPKILDDWLNSSNQVDVMLPDS